MAACPSSWVVRWLATLCLQGEKGGGEGGRCDEEAGGNSSPGSFMFRIHCPSGKSPAIRILKSTLFGDSFSFAHPKAMLLQAHIRRVQQILILILYSVQLFRASSTSKQETSNSTAGDTGISARVFIRRIFRCCFQPCHSSELDETASQ